MKADPPNKTPTASLARQTAAAVAGAAAILILIVLPAERGVDLVGFGKITGLSKLAAPQRAASTPIASTKTAYESPVPFRTDVLEIKLDPEGEIERKVWMEAGQTLVYSWTADRDVYSDFHGETLPQPQVTVAEYRVLDPMTGGNPRAANGSLTAPMSGFHGWYFMNLDTSPVTIRVKIAGYYELRTYPPPE